PIAQPPVFRPPVAQPPVFRPPVFRPPVAEPPVFRPPVFRPPVAEPPVFKPPGVITLPGGPTGGPVQGPVGKLPDGDSPGGDPGFPGKEEPQAAGAPGGSSGGISQRGLASGTVGT